MKSPFPGLLILAAGVLLAAPVRAERISLQVNGGFSTYNLDDVNDAGDRANELAGQEVFSPVHSGWSAGLGAGYTLDAELTLGLAYERLMGSTSYSGGSLSAEFDLPADLYKIFLDYLPANGNSVRVGAGAATGMVRSAASYQESDLATSSLEKMDFDGTGFLFEGYVLAETALGSRWALFGQGGFRHAIVGQVTTDGRTIYNPDSLDDKLRLNYSGIFLRLGLKFQP